ncbi:hypothetical protein AYO20_09816 [Fonsecaea nubica]|uniref:DNA-directed RNA polymerase RBP11-like dimerisation domain-containing protein n=1 Tax=Fonsecaea nubica TaxID=856822 RepID=A0A178CB73_9EURO|nr:hypothetical protein AYO20_09816 [Fonsecaea nubica]OAL27218.1 hypothetical protein AYO20_09816 [Fonsecaea nubica]
MSETPSDQAAATDDQTPPMDTLSPRRTLSGQLIIVENQRWPDHPKNKYRGSVNSGIDTNSVNIPATSGSVNTTTAAVTEDPVEMAGTEDPGLPSIPDPASLSSPSKPRSNTGTYPGAGPGGWPIDGSAWRNHPANRPYQFFQLEQMHHEEINRLEWCAFCKRQANSWIPNPCPNSSSSNHACLLSRHVLLQNMGLTHANCWANSTEAFLLGDDEKKIEEKIDTRTPNTTIFTFNKEDHTLANLLRDKLLKNSHVTFAAYRIPHPLFAKFELRVQTDGEITPKEAVLASSRDLVHDLDVLKTNFTREYELRKMVGGAQNGQ